MLMAAVATLDEQPLNDAEHFPQYFNFLFSLSFSSVLKDKLTALATITLPSCPSHKFNQIASITISGENFQSITK